MLTQGPYESAMDVLRALAEPTRLRLVWALAAHEHSVGELAELVGANVAAVSQHLAKLREAGMVVSRRDGTRIFYRVATSHVADLLDQLVVVSGHVSGGLDLPRPASAPAEAPAVRRAAVVRSRQPGGHPRAAEA